MLCDFTHILLNELKLGEESHFAPYVKYLLGQEKGQIPATWTEPAKELLLEVVSEAADKTYLTDLIEVFEDEECIEAGNALEQQALAMVVQRGWRGWDSVLIPIYDMMNHVNDEEKLNTDSNSVFSAEGVLVWASKIIEVGEEVFLTYDNCSDCDGISEHSGTEELLQDFGFVELYPQTFYFQEAQALFSVDKVTNEEERKSHHVEIEWLGDESPSYEGIAWMKEEYQRLQTLQYNGTLSKRQHLMPEKEWNTIFQYHQALTVALKVAIEDLEGDNENVYYDEL